MLKDVWKASFNNLLIMRIESEISVSGCVHQQVVGIVGVLHLLGRLEAPPADFDLEDDELGLCNHRNLAGSEVLDWRSLCRYVRCLSIYVKLTVDIVV